MSKIFWPLDVHASLLPVRLADHCMQPMWDFKALTADAFRSMLRYLYYGEQELSSVNACELLPVSRHVVLPDLQALCQKKYASFALRSYEAKQCCAHCISGLAPT